MKNKNIQQKVNENTAANNKGGFLQFSIFFGGMIILAILLGLLLHLISK